MKGRKKRSQDGPKTLYANVGEDVMAYLDTGAKLLGVSRAAFVEELVRRDFADGPPPWLKDLADAAQLPLELKQSA